MGLHKHELIIVSPLWSRAMIFKFGARDRLSCMSQMAQSQTGPFALTLHHQASNQVTLAAVEGTSNEGAGYEGE